MSPFHNPRLSVLFSSFLERNTSPLEALATKAAFEISEEELAALFVTILHIEDIAFRNCSIQDNCFSLFQSNAFATP